MSDIIKGNIDNFKSVLSLIHPSFITFNSDSCIICYEQISIIANPKCDHCVCFICAIRLIKKENNLFNCPCCQIESQIILTHSQRLSNSEKESILRRKLDRFKKITFQDTIAYIPKHNIYIYSEKKPILQKISQSIYLLIGKICWHRDCITRLSKLLAEGDSDIITRSDFDSLGRLSSHLSSSHNICYCELCYEHFRPFMYEITYYRKDQLSKHRNKGDLSCNPKIDPHIFCKYCKKWFFDTEAYKIHSRSAHFICSLCDLDKDFKVFPDYSLLFSHFKEIHFPCFEESCAFVVFTTNAELLIHYAVEHPEKSIPEHGNIRSNIKIKVGNIRRNVVVDAPIPTPIPIIEPVNTIEPNNNDIISDESELDQVDEVISTSSEQSVDGGFDDYVELIPSSKLSHLKEQCELIDGIIDEMEGCEVIFARNGIPDSGSSMELLREKASKLANCEDDPDILLKCSIFIRLLISSVLSYTFTPNDISKLDRVKSLLGKRFYNLDLSCLSKEGLLLLSLVVMIPQSSLSKYLCRRSILPDQWSDAQLKVQHESRNSKNEHVHVHEHIHQNVKHQYVNHERVKQTSNFTSSNPSSNIPNPTVKHVKVKPHRGMDTFHSTESNIREEFPSESSGIINKLRKAAFNAYKSHWSKNSVHACLLETIERSLDVQWKLHVLPSVRESIRERISGVDPSCARQLSNMSKDLGGLIPMRLIEECQALTPLFYLYYNQTGNETLERWAEKWSESVTKAFRRVKMSELCAIYCYLISIRDIVANINDEKSFPPLLQHTNDNSRSSGENSLMRSFRRMDFASAISKTNKTKYTKPSPSDFPSLDKSIRRK